ncbi:MAG TPA: Fe-S cluster assembly protein SufD, partial [Thermoplasmata archaeon]|nr:Fe-S cluster assembly protein SufD [Thermoplasmata archaeon]
MALDARQAYVTEFRSSEEERRAPPWLFELRKSAIDRFDAVGFPTQKQEDWKYTNLAPLLRIPFKPAILARPDGVVAEKLEPFTFGVLKTTLLVFVNGRFAPRLSYLRPRPEGVRVASLAEVLKEEAATLEPHLGRIARSEDDPFASLNTALFADGAYVEVPNHTAVEEPIHLLFVSTSKDLPIVAHPRNLIRIGA